MGQEQEAQRLTGEKTWSIADLWKGSQCGCVQGTIEMAGDEAAGWGLWSGGCSSQAPGAEV